MSEYNEWDEQDRQEYNRALADNHESKLILASWLQPVTPLPSAAGDNTRVLCDWCGQKPGIHGGECDDCWRLPGHEGEGAESAEVVELRAENKRLHTLIQLALINAPYDEPLNIKTPKLLLAQAWAFWELRQRILLSNQALATHDHAANG